MRRERDLDRDESASLETPAGSATEHAGRPPETAFEPPTDEPEARADERLVVPVVEETVRIAKHPVERGVRIETRVVQRSVDLDVPLEAEDVEVERHAVNRVVDAPPRTEERGGILVVPVVEEVVVYERKFLVREEIHVRKQHRRGRAVARVPVRAEEVTVHELGPDRTRRSEREGTERRRDPMERQQDTRSPLGERSPRVDIVEAGKGHKKSSTALWIALLAIALVVVLIVVGLI